MQYGKVQEYNGFTGFIKGLDGKNYILTNDNINKLVDDIKEGDNVSFTPEEYKTIEINKNIARNIKVLTKEYFDEYNYNNTKKQ